MNPEIEEFKEGLKEKFAWLILMWEYAPVHVVLSAASLLAACAWVVLFRLDTSYWWLILPTAALSAACIVVNVVTRQKWLLIMSAAAFAVLAGVAAILSFFPQLWSFEPSRFGPAEMVIVLLGAVYILAPRLLHPCQVCIRSEE